MPLPTSDLDMLKQFAAKTTRAVLITRRKDGGLQSSPMAVIADDNGDVLTATRARNAKTYNLTRDPRAVLCLMDERWPGPWLHVEGQASITRLPEAMPLLAAYYGRRGQDTQADAFRQRMETENRVLIRIKIDRLVRPPSA
ncbi:MAG: TIGR03618 family F420-dependent PPOX class oxidoreductase [Chloroflexi bacterium]|nr:TIGR03618 family F420-dependent PPOX class oxidoreductase [Chloroflexota bacterium]MBV9597604.1 TIGR03618 family F420-dependent PPOX class oxidoreductase [Chloroflexota bacterium]